MEMKPLIMCAVLSGNGRGKSENWQITLKIGHFSAFRKTFAKCRRVAGRHTFTMSLETLCNHVSRGQKGRHLRAINR